MEHIQSIGAERSEAGIPSPHAASLQSLPGVESRTRRNGTWWLSELGEFGPCFNSVRDSVWFQQHANGDLAIKKWDLGQAVSKRINYKDLEPSLTVKHMDFRAKHWG